MRYLFTFLNYAKITINHILVPECHGWPMEDFGEAQLGDVAVLAEGLQISNLQHEAFLREIAAALKRGGGK